MMKYIKKLAEIGSSPIEAAPVNLEQLSSALGGEEARLLLALLNLKNGFYAFESAFHVLSASGNAQEYGLMQWNSPALWRKEYADMAEGCIFFAEDVFGVQFCLRDMRVFTFDPETGGLELFSGSIDEWAEKILDNYSVLTGHKLARQWQLAYGAIPIGSRLLPKIPFIMGGAYAVDNLYALEAAQGMRYRACIAMQIRDLPDGSKVKLTVVE